MILVDSESVSTAEVYGGSGKTNRNIVFLAVLCGMCMSACSSQDSETRPVETLPKQPVSVTDINRLLNEGLVANQQLAEQLARQSRPFGGQLNLELNLADTKITDEELESLTLPDNLTRVDLTRTNITDDGLAHLVSGTNIVDLVLVDTRITAKGLVHLRAMPNLRTVNLHNTDVPVKDQLELLRFLKNRPQE